MSNVYYSTLLNTHCFKAACVMETALSFKDIFQCFFFLRKVHLLKKDVVLFWYKMSCTYYAFRPYNIISYSYSRFIFNIIISVVCNNRGCI